MRHLLKNRKKKIPILCFLVFLLLILAGFTQVEGGVPENPLNKDCIHSDMYLSEGGQLSLNGAVRGQFQGRLHKKESKNQKKEKKTGKGGQSKRNLVRLITHANQAAMFQNGVTGESGETEREYFVTTIEDNSTVYSREYAFSVIQKTKLRVVSLNVYVNGIEQLQFHGPVLLEEGKNTIRVSVVYKDTNGKLMTVFRDYTLFVQLENSENKKAEPTPDKAAGPTQSVQPEDNETPKPTETPGPEKALEIITDLKEQSVHDSQISFHASLRNGTQKARLTVVCNGKTLKGKGGVYQTALNIGSNRIRLKATDTVKGEAVLISKTVKITYVPVATEKTAPYFQYINVQDGMSVRGTKFVLNLKPVDYLENRIYHESITVRLNDTICEYRFLSEYTSYLLEFQNGKNVLNIRLTDKDGRFADFSYTIYCTAVKDGEELGQITLSIDANVLGLGFLAAPKKVTIYQGDTAAETIVKFLEKEGFSYRHMGSLNSGFYLSRLEKKGIAADVHIPEELEEFINQDGLEWKEQRFEDSIGEFDYCQGSGFMYEINQSFPGNGISDAVFKDGDVIRIRYTLAYGKDIGGYAVTDSGGKNYDKTW